MIIEEAHEEETGSKSKSDDDTLHPMSQQNPLSCSSITKWIDKLVFITEISVKIISTKEEQIEEETSLNTQALKTSQVKHVDHLNELSRKRKQEIITTNIPPNQQGSSNTKYNIKIIQLELY